MTRLDRYILAQLFTMFGFFALILVLIYWVNRAVLLFDWLIAEGQPFSVFLEFTALWLPPVVALVMPMAAFAGAVYVTNRLSSESELTVMQAAGASPWRLARPVVLFGLILAAMMSALVHYLVPASVAELRQRQSDISGSLSARLLREGTFLHPTHGVTFFVREISPEGELRGVFLSDRRDAQREVAYTADRAYVFDDDSGPKLVMVEGMAQIFTPATRQLATTNFRDLSYDVSSLVQARSHRPRLRELSTAELLADPEGVARRLAAAPGEVRHEAHARFNQALQVLDAALIGFATLLLGSFSRFGVWRQILLAIFFLVVVKFVESVTTEPARSIPGLWGLAYLNGILGLGLGISMLWLASRPDWLAMPRRLGRRRRREAAA